MRDTARAATVASEMHAFLLARAGRTEPPPRHRKGQGRRNTLASIGKRHSDSNTNRAEAAAQEAVRVAIRRALALEHKAEIAMAIGLDDAGLRFAALASDIRSAVLA